MSDTTERIVAEVALQGRACRNLGSPLYADLMARAADDAAAGGVVAEILTPFADQPTGSAITLRLFGAVHRLALCGDAPELAAIYPSCGGDPNGCSTEELWEIFGNTCRRHLTAIADRMRQAPQTNEVGRTAALRGALDIVAGAAPFPVRLIEIGASAGLNLLPDHYALRWPGGFRGPSSSPVMFEDAWTGNIPPEPDLHIVDRVGCDINPLDASDPDDAMTLQSFVWADQTARLDRLRGALRVADANAVSVDRCSADDLLTTVEPTHGVLTVIQHSVMWQYMPDEVRNAATEQLRRLAGSASADAPVAHISLEPPRTADDGDVDFRAARRHGGFIITAGCAPYFDDQVVGYCPPHGPPAHWL